MRTKILNRLGSAALIIAVSVYSFLAVSALAEEETPHTKLGSTTANQAGDTETDLCAFCHTPYGKVKTPVTPNWNRAIKEQNTATAFRTVGISASGSDSEEVGPASLVCLGCHDGTQAQDSGGINPHPIPQSSDEQNPSLRRRQTPYLIRSGHRDQNDSHPVGVPYARGDARLLDLPALANRRLPRSELEFRRPERDIVNQLTVWWLETGQAGRQKTDIQLYTRPDPISGDPVPFVECASCHDPHGKTPMMLRVERDYGRLCNSCHNL